MALTRRRQVNHFSRMDPASWMIDIKRLACYKTRNARRSMLDERSTAQRRTLLTFRTSLREQTSALQGTPRSRDQVPCPPRDPTSMRAHGLHVQSMCGRASFLHRTSYILFFGFLFLDDFKHSRILRQCQLTPSPRHGPSSPRWTSKTLSSHSAWDISQTLRYGTSAVPLTKRRTGRTLANHARVT